MVRVATDKSQTRAAWLSLMGAIGAGLIAVLALTLLREPEPHPAPQRSLTSFRARWTCERNPEHEFTALGRFNAMPCQEPGCDGQCWIRQRFICLAHNSKFDVWVRFERVTSGGVDTERIVAYRYAPNGPWHDAVDGKVACPVPGCSSVTRPSNTAWSDRDRRQATVASPSPAPQP